MQPTPLKVNKPGRGWAFLPLANAFTRRVFRLRPVEPLPFTVAARRIYILPTRQGVAFSLLLLGMLLGAVNYSLSMGYLFTFLLIGMMLSALFATWHTLLGLGLQQIEPLAGFAGDTVQFRLVWQLPGTRMASALVASTSEARAELEQLTPHAGAHLAEAKLTVPAQQRGRQPLGACRLETEAPLGLFRAWCVFMPAATALVWPKPAARGMPLPVVAGQSDEKTPLTQRGAEDFNGLKSYQPGESPSRLAWKSVARQHSEGAQPLVKDFTAPMGQALWLNWDALPGLDTEARLSLLTRWVLDADQQQMSYGLTLPAQRIAPGSGAVQRLRCLNALALHGLPDAKLA